MKKLFLSGLIILFSGAFLGCTSSKDPVSNVSKKIAMNAAKKTAKSAAKEGIASAVSTSAYMSDLEKELNIAIKGTTVKSIRKGNTLTLTLNGQHTFNANSYNLKPVALAQLQKIAPVLCRYDQTRITIFGHTEKVGKPATNQLLSEKRADSVADIFENEGIADSRFFIEGKGSTAPLAGIKPENIQNNRIEIVLTKR